ncbi:MAG: lipopolysaccharide biosynthesis protein [Paludibacter sp.]|jgi:O-antigen/teichoic acid export membrane protein|nr:lipopolysaccharide biosynthesis protein [Paludibacter sp.]
MGDQLKQKMISAVAWSTIDKFGQQILQFIAGLVFARLLMPADFGLMGIVMIFVAISLILVESGFGQALIRKTDISPNDYTSVYYFNLVTAILLYSILFLLAPLISEFFHQSQLVEMIRVVSLVIVVNAFYLIPYAQLGRAMNFKTISTVNLISVTCGALAGIGVALFDFGVWALVIQQSVYHLVKMLLLQVVVSWQPTGKFRFSIIRDLWNYSVKILFTSLVNVIFNNLFIIILGRSYSKAEAGQFSQGNKLSETFSYTFQSIFAGSTFALFSQLQNDIPRFGRILGEMIRRTSLVTIPVISVLIVLASPLITFLWTDKFQPAVIYFQLMSMASVLTPFYVMNLNALNARGKSGQTMAIELIKKLLIVVGIFLLYKQGIVFMLFAYVVGSLLAYPVSVLFVKNEFQLSFRNQIGFLLPGLATGLITAGVAMLLQLALPWSALPLLIAQGSVSLVVYLIIIRIFFRSLFDKFLTFTAKYIPVLKKFA